MIRIASLLTLFCLMTAPLFAAEPSSDTALADDMAAATQAATPPPQEVAPTLDTDKGSTISVVEFVVAQSIKNREPVDVASQYTATPERLFAFTRINTKTPQTITHVWYRNEEKRAEIALRIGASPAWRTWSSKAIFPKGPADWRVEVTSEDGTPLAETRFTVE